MKASISFTLVFTLVAGLILASVYIDGAGHKHDYGLLEHWKRQRILPSKIINIKDNKITLQAVDKYETTIVEASVEDGYTVVYKDHPYRVGDSGLLIYCEADKVMMAFIRND